MGREKEQGWMGTVMEQGWMGKKNGLGDRKRCSGLQACARLTTNHQRVEENLRFLQPKTKGHMVLCCAVHTSVHDLPTREVAESPHRTHSYPAQHLL